MHLHGRRPAIKPHLIAPFILLFAATFTLAVQPSTADARCTGTNSPATWSSDIGKEGAQTYGCTGSHTYLGWDLRVSGAYVYVVALKNGIWTLISTSKNFSSTSQINYYFSDDDGNAPLRLTACGPSGCAYDQFTNYGF